MVGEIDKRILIQFGERIHGYFIYKSRDTFAGRIEK